MREEKLAKVCRRCFWYKHEQAKAKCFKGPKHKCQAWASKKIPRMCANCIHFGNPDVCESNNADDVCMDWEQTEEEVSIPNKDEVRKMLNRGDSPTALTKALNTEVVDTTFEIPLAPEQPHNVILKHHLNTIFKILPGAENNAIRSPKMSNVYAVTALLSASRDILDDIRDLQDPGEMYARMVTELFEPLTTKMLEILTINLNNSRGSIRQVLDQKEHTKLDTIMNTTLKNIGTEMQGSLQTHLSHLKEMLGVEE